MKEKIRGDLDIVTSFDVTIEHQRAIESVFEGMSPAFINIATKYNRELHIDETNILVVDGKIQKECSYYEEDTKTIFMNGDKTSYEYAEAFRHEYGHFIDHMLGQISDSENFSFALEADKYWLTNGIIKDVDSFSMMLTNLSSNKAIFSRYVSDIFSGIFLNDDKIREIYASQGIPFYGHDTYNYWLGCLPEEKIIQKEIFANLFAIYMKGESDCVDFIESWFPNVTKLFKKEIEKFIYD